MKKLTLLMLLAGVLTAGSALPGCIIAARPGFMVVDVAPPPPRTVVVTSRQGYVWVEGRWVWDGVQWQWNDGYWVRHRPGYVYTQGYWHHRGGRYHWVKGGWHRGQRHRNGQGDQVRDHRGASGKVKVETRPGGKQPKQEKKDNVRDHRN